MNNNIRWLRDKIKMLDMQGIIISNPINIKYLTGIEADGVFLITPKENIYIDLSDNPINEEDENKIDIKYIYKVKNILKESLNYYSKYTKLNKNKSFVIYITTDGDLTIYVSPVDSNEIEEIYPKGEGVYR